jgi:hypothetical protein
MPDAEVLPAGEHDPNDLARFIAHGRLFHRLLPSRAMPLGLDTWNGLAAPRGSVDEQSLLDYQESGCDPGPLQGRTRYHWRGSSSAR